MSLQLKPGLRLYSAADASEFIVVRGSAEVVDLRIGGRPALLDGSARTDGLEVTTPSEYAPSVGKRYVGQGGAVELLCVKAGLGAPAIGEQLLEVKGANPLPASD